MKKLLHPRICLVIVLILMVFQPANGATGISPLTSSQVHGLGAEIQLSGYLNPDVDRYLPDVVYNPNKQESLIVWHVTEGSQYRIEGRRMNRSGPIGDPMILVFDTVPVKQPAVVYNSTDNVYFLVWMQNTSGDGIKYELWSKVISADDFTTVIPEFNIFLFENPFTYWTPRVAWNPRSNRYFIVYTEFNPNNMLPVGVYGWVLDHTTNNGRSVILSEVNAPQNPDVVYNAQANQYYVVWRAMSSGVSYGQIFGARVIESSVYPVDPNPIPLNPTTNDQRYPRLATNNTTSYMVVWEEFVPGFNNWYVIGREVDLNATPLRKQQLISANIVSTEESMPTVAGWDGPASRYMVTYQVGTTTGTSVYMVFNDNYNNTIEFLGYINWIDSFPVMDAGFWNTTRPEVAVTRPGEAIIAYQGDSTSDPSVKQHIYARTWSAYLTWIPVILR